MIDKAITMGREGMAIDDVIAAGNMILRIMIENTTKKGMGMSTAVNEILAKKEFTTDFYFD